MFCCQRCGKALASKQNLVNHLNRKFLCNPDVSDEQPDSLLANIIAASDAKDSYSTFACKYGCDRYFKYKNNMYAHLKKCENKDVLSELRNKIQKLEKEIKNRPPITIINNTNNNNVQVNIAIRDFDRDENVEYIPKRFIFNCFTNKTLIPLIEKIHFHPEHPENHNVRIKNVKMGLMEYFDQGEWKVGKKNDVLGHLANAGWRVLDKLYLDHREKLECRMDDRELDECLRWLKKVSEEDSRLNQELKSSLFCMVVGKKAFLLRKD